MAQGWAQFVFGNGNSGSFPGTITGPPLVTTGQARRERALPGTVTGNQLSYGKGDRTSAGYCVTPNLGMAVDSMSMGHEQVCTSRQGVAFAALAVSHIEVLY